MEELGFANRQHELGDGQLISNESPPPPSRFSQGVSKRLGSSSVLSGCEESVHVDLCHGHLLEGRPKSKRVNHVGNQQEACTKSHHQARVIELEASKGQSQP